ncbi:H-2 class II histocompatibility antigen, A-R alpha chain-like [Chiloscyllium plagiosum]|uniref:H-2 class II histocompatibility antigen, A-R alpha chain-like n=1 Tax=Chiloscyllium plagiosum TaxID=36176 RepID=UPI001CB7F473|nr:H-2 class II histocompatibility antigen, A-R alpha chain-like [Chiloscyllium plagiosum]
MKNIYTHSFPSRQSVWSASLPLLLQLLLRCRLPAAPQIVMYPEKPAKWGQLNTLICLADGFYPPHITMRWKRNSEPVTDEVNITEFCMKQDHSYQRFTYLSFIPNPGDMYSCHVEHDGLQDPTTVFWEPEVPEEQSGPWTVICIVGIILGIISAVVAVILLIKERKRLQPLASRDKYRVQGLCL